MSSVPEGDLSPRRGAMMAMRCQHAKEFAACGKADLMPASAKAASKLFEPSLSCH